MLTQSLGEALDLSLCDREPIHIPGHIQPHGFLLVLAEPEYTIIQLSQNTVDVLQLPLEELLGKNLIDILDEKQATRITTQISTHPNLKELNPLVCGIKVKNELKSFEVSLHRSDNLLLLEFEAMLSRDESSFADNTFFRLAQKSLSNLSEIDSLDELLQAAAREVKHLIGFDRIMIYQFDDTGCGEVVAEMKEPELAPYLGLHYPASDIPKQARELYRRNVLRLIPNVEYVSSPLVPTYNPLTGKPLDLSFSVLRSVSPIHIQYLKNMGVKASMSISLLRKEQLWGLIACHHYSSSKMVPYEIRAICEFLGRALSWQISTILENKHYHIITLQREQLAKLIKAMKPIFSNSNQWPKKLLAHENNLLNLVGAEGAIISYNQDCYPLGRVPPLEELERLVDYLSANLQTDIFHTVCLSNLYPAAEKYKDLASGLLVARLADKSNNMICWFKPEIIQKINWAGDPHKSFVGDEAEMQLAPRNSFALWQEEIQATSLPWTNIDIQICNEFRSFLLEVIIVGQEVSRLQEFEFLKQKQEEFIDTICHELRNPISGIEGCLILIKEQLHNIESLAETYSNEEGKNLNYTVAQYLNNIYEGINDINECVAHQTLIANDVLEMSKLNLNPLKLNNSPCDLKATAQIAINMVKSKIDEKALQFEFNCPEEHLFIKGDERRIKQIIINLINNAIKFTEKGMIKLSLYEIASTNDYKSIQIIVEDTGIGMTKAEVSKLFARFSQGNREISLKYGGSGLGLNLCRQFAQAMGGDITVKSKKGIGSKFIVTLTLDHVTENEQAEIGSRQKLSIKGDTPPSPARKKDNIHVLIVEDNKLNLKILSMHLSKAGYTYQTARNGQEALNLFLANKFDIVLMDIEMPVMNGYETTRVIRQKERELGVQPTPIIGLSAHVRQELQDKALRAGMDDYLTKPYTFADIKSKLKHWIKTKTVIAALPPPAETSAKVTDTIAPLLPEEALLGSHSFLGQSSTHSSSDEFNRVFSGEPSSSFFKSKPKDAKGKVENQSQDDPKTFGGSSINYDG